MCNPGQQLLLLPHFTKEKQMPREVEKLAYSYTPTKWYSQGAHS